MITTPTLTQARKSTVELSKRTDVTDIMMQGIGRSGLGVVQAILLRPSEAYPVPRRFVAIELDSHNWPSGKTSAIRIDTTPADGDVESHYSMVSTRKRLNSDSEGILHVMGISRRTRLIAEALALPDSYASLSTITSLTGPEFGITQLLGTAYMGTTVQRLKPFYNYQMGLLADRRPPRKPHLDKHEVDVQIPIKQPYQASFRTAGNYGVARAIYNTTTNQDTDYATQPTLVSLGNNGNARTIEDIADHLVTRFNPAAIALRWIPRDYPADVEQFVWNAYNPEVPTPAPSTERSALQLPLF